MNKEYTLQSTKRTDYVGNMLNKHFWFEIKGLRLQNELVYSLFHGPTILLFYKVKRLVENILITYGVV